MSSLPLSFSEGSRNLPLICHQFCTVMHPLTAGIVHTCSLACIKRLEQYNNLPRRLHNYAVPVLNAQELPASLWSRASQDNCSYCIIVSGQRVAHWMEQQPTDMIFLLATLYTWQPLKPPSCLVDWGIVWALQSFVEELSSKQSEQHSCLVLCKPSHWTAHCHVTLMRALHKLWLGL